MNAKEIIASRTAKELEDGDVVNLGIGLPTMVSNYVPEGLEITLQSENGILGMSGLADETNTDSSIVNAGGVPVAVNNFASFFDSSMSFSIIRGGHVDKTVLGALEVDEHGNLANYIIPGKMVPGMGGAMDLVTGSKKVIVAMTHTAKGDAPKILKNITLPPTALGKVDLIITELGVMEITPDGIVLTEVAEGVTPEEVQSKTDATLIISPNLKTF